MKLKKSLIKLVIISLMFLAGSFIFINCVNAKSLDSEQQMLDLYNITQKYPDGVPVENIANGNEYDITGNGFIDLHDYKYLKIEYTIDKYDGELLVSSDPYNKDLDINVDGVINKKDLKEIKSREGTQDGIFAPVKQIIEKIITAIKNLFNNIFGKQL